MIILAIDTSCDDTSISIIEEKNNNPKILSNIVSSQVKLHALYGGVYPSLAKREHQRNLSIVLEKSLSKAGLLKLKTKKTKKTSENKTPTHFPSAEFLDKYKKPKIGLIAVTIGPGLEPCLWQGINFAILLAKELKVKIVPVNHIEGHILANLLLPVGKNPNLQTSTTKKIVFPAICLVVSGGHTQLILMKNIGKYKIIGETRDDAAGECFDKTARILGLPYPGGPAIAAEAAKFSISNSQFSIKLPRPMANSRNYDFSFSGLKTAVLYDFKKRPKEVRASKRYVQEMAKEIQQAIIDVLIKKTLKAAMNFNAKSVILGGGVAANKELRKQLREKIKTELPNVKLFIPEPKLCTDNAAMIAQAAYFHRKSATDRWKKIRAKARLKIKNVD
ncbi:tRNA (adenosine(37)-N6)-threonylcarbamoyltransferase complex transferase subunit TsaD [bacterium]|nr:tRNA (adenosine(37)-N6)-threonylcarbamoyltransferase complex transferase subunit TsaD [bacterium]